MRRTPAFFQALALPTYLFLQLVQLAQVAVSESECAAPESAIDIRSFVAPLDLLLGCQINGRYAWLLAGILAYLVDLTGTWHVVK